MRILVISTALAALALPAGAAAQAPGDYYEGDVYGDYQVAPPYEEPLYDQPLSQRLGDPVVQDQMASTIAVFGEVLLDLPLAPILEPMAEIAGRDPGSVDPDMTLRKMNPEAGDVAARAARELPQAMDAMAAMAGSIEAMRPALDLMADRLRAGIDQARRGAY
jgi:hypothetical protein